MNLAFCRSLNRIIFDRTVECDPFTFGFVSQPEEENVVVPERGQQQGIVGHSDLERIDTCTLKSVFLCMCNMIA